jgi:hypothetical protein
LLLLLLLLLLLQVDSLFPTLTCRETLNFAEVCCGQSGALADAVVSMMSWEETHPGAVDRCHLDDEVRGGVMQLLLGFANIQALLAILYSQLSMTCHRTRL